mgnify:CR=1 FL=1
MLGDALDDRQPEPRPGPRAARDPVEAITDARQFKVKELVMPPVRSEL